MFLIFLWPVWKASKRSSALALWLSIIILSVCPRNWQIHFQCTIKKSKVPLLSAFLKVNYEEVLCCWHFVSFLWFGGSWRANRWAAVELSVKLDQPLPPSAESDLLRQLYIVAIYIIIAVYISENQAALLTFLQLFIPVSFSLHFSRFMSPLQC